MGKAKIKFLRGTADAISKSIKVLEYGQPLFDNTNKYLYIGDGSSIIQNLSPITVSELNNNLGDFRIYRYGQSSYINSKTGRIVLESTGNILLSASSKDTIYRGDISINAANNVYITPKTSTNIQGSTINIGASTPYTRNINIGAKQEGQVICSIDMKATSLNIDADNITVTKLINGTTTNAKTVNGVYISKDSSGNILASDDSIFVRKKLLFESENGAIEIPLTIDYTNKILEFWIKGNEYNPSDKITSSHLNKNYFVKIMIDSLGSAGIASYQVPTLFAIGSDYCYITTINIIIDFVNKKISLNIIDNDIKNSQRKTSTKKYQIYKIYQVLEGEATNIATGDYSGPGEIQIG